MSNTLNKVLNILFIVNPVSGNGKSKKIFPKVEKYLKEHHIRYEVNYTKYKGHAIEIAKESRLRNDVTAIVAVGGDGTLFEIINGIYPTEIPLGYIPTGTGNDYGRQMGISNDPIIAVKRILKLDVRNIDIGQINERLFLNVSSLGFDGQIAKYANESKLKKFGKLVYIIGVIKALWSFKPKEIYLKIDDNIHTFKGVWLIAIANNKYYGGGMMISPNSINDDGVLDVCVIKDLSRFKLLRIFPTIFNGTHIKYPYVTLLKGKNIMIETEDEIVVQSDGEILEEHEVNIKIIKKGLRII